MLFHAQTEKAQGLVEFAFIILLIAIVVFVALALMGPVVGDLYSQVVDAFP